MKLEAIYSDELKVIHKGFGRKTAEERLPLPKPNSSNMFGACG